MHQIDLGLFFHVRDRLIKFYKWKGQTATMKELDARLAIVRETCRIQHLPLPSGSYFHEAANLTAAEHRAVFEVLVAISGNLLREDHVKMLRHLMNWHKLVTQVEFKEGDFAPMRQEAMK